MHYIAHLLKSMMFWLKCNTHFCHTTADRELFLPELLSDVRRAGIQHMRSVDVYYCTSLSWRPCCTLWRTHSGHHTHTHTHLRAVLLSESVRQRAWLTRVWAKPSEIMHETMKIFSVSTPHPNLRGTGGFQRFHASNTREEMKVKSETCDLKPLV